MSLAQRLIMGYGGTVGPVFVGPLDTYSSNLWFAGALTRLLSSYSGPLIRVRRASDNAEQDIGYDSTTNPTGPHPINTTALLAFTGASTAYVVTVYGQQGGSNNMFQAAYASQARIVNAGVYDGKMVFDGSDDHYGSTANSGTPTAFCTYFNGLLRSTATDQIILEQSANYNSNDGAIVYYDQSSFGAMLVGFVNIPNYARNLFSQTPNGTSAARINRSEPVLTDKTAWFTGATKRTPTGNNNAGTPAGNFLARPWYMGARSGGVLAAQLDARLLAIYETAHNDSTAIAISTAITGL